MASAGDLLGPLPLLPVSLAGKLRWVSGDCRFAASLPCSRDIFDGQPLPTPALSWIGLAVPATVVTGLATPSPYTIPFSAHACSSRVREGSLPCCGAFGPPTKVILPFHDPQPFHLAPTVEALLSFSKIGVGGLLVTW